MSVLVYPISNTFTRDIPLDEQIQLDICEWEAEHEETGYTHVGRSQEEAKQLLANLLTCLGVK